MEDMDTIIPCITGMVVMVDGDIHGEDGSIIIGDTPYGVGVVPVRAGGIPVGAGAIIGIRFTLHNKALNRVISGWGPFYLRKS